jgi:outer membrane lipoprotein-sorting protein
MTVLLLLVPQEPRLDQIVDGVVRTYSKMNDFSAEFVQTTKDISNQRHTYRGLLYLKSGRRMVYEQREPEPKFLYSDGKLSTEYRVVPKQAEVTPLGKSENELFQIFQIPWHPEWKSQFERFELLNEREQKPVTAGNLLVRALPKDREKKGLPVILLEVDPRTFLIHRFVTTSPDGETNEFRFAGIKTERLNPSMFEFKAPAGVEVIRNR